jgi:hypothetical protein
VRDGVARPHVHLSANKKLRLDYEVMPEVVIFMLLIMLCNDLVASFCNLQLSDVFDNIGLYCSIWPSLFNTYVYKSITELDFSKIVYKVKRCAVTVLLEATGIQFHMPLLYFLRMKCINE